MKKKVVKKVKKKFSVIFGHQKNLMSIYKQNLDLNLKK